MSRSILITGANQGLGLATVRALAQRETGWTLIKAIRDPEKAELARRAILAATPAQKIAVLPLDLSSLSEVRAVPDRLKAQALPPLGALVCNAAVQNWTAIHRSADGYELTFAVNVLAHALLTLLLLDAAMIAPDARILMVSSGVHDARLPTGIAKPVLASAAKLAEPSLWGNESVRTFGQRAYSSSKLAILMFALELDRRLRESGEPAPAVLAFDPGGMPSSLIRDWPKGLQRAMHEHHGRFGHGAGEARGGPRLRRRNGPLLQRHRPLQCRREGEAARAASRRPRKMRRSL